MSNLLAGIALLLIAAAAALFAVPQFVDWNRYRGVFEEEASRLAGRDVRVGGNLSLRLLPTPAFRIEKIRVADREAGTGEALFRAEALSARLSVAPLLRGVLEANELELISPQVRIASASLAESAAPRPPSPTAPWGGAIPFLPNDLSLPSVKITDGALIVDGADRRERLRLVRIDGELSAAALEGPFRFRGTYGEADRRRELRLTTNRTEADGAVRFRALLKDLVTGSAYALDGRAAELATAMKIEGQLTAEVFAPGVVAAKAADAAPMLEVKANVGGSAAAIRLTDLALTFDPRDRPQALAGTAAFDPARNELRVALAARTLDLDHIGPQRSAAAGGPVAALFDLLQRMSGAAPDGGTYAVSLVVDQIALGREPVGSLALDLAGDATRGQIRELRLGLPGGARADVAGWLDGRLSQPRFDGRVAQPRIDGRVAQPRFDGEVFVRGGSLARLLAWASEGGLVLDPARDGPFAVRTRLGVGEGLLQARDVVAELAGTIGQGEVAYRWGAPGDAASPADSKAATPRRELAVTIEGPQVDLRPLIAAEAHRNPIVAALAAVSRTGLKPDDLDAVLRLNAGQLLLPSGTYQDAAVELELRNRRLRVSRLELNGDHGARLELQGELGESDGRPTGRLRGLIAAERPAAIAVLAPLIGWPEGLLDADGQRLAVTPLRLAGSIGFSDQQAIDIAARGSAGTSNVQLAVRLERGLDAWRSAPLDVTATVEGAESEALVQAVFGVDPARRARRAPSTSRVSVRARGTLADGVETVARLEAGDATAQFAGRVTALDPLRLSGALDVAAKAGHRLQAWLPTGLPPGLGRLPVEGAVRLEMEAGRKIVLSAIEVQVDGAAVLGDIAVDATSAPPRLTGRLDASRISLAALLRPWSERAPALTADASVGAAESLLRAAADGAALPWSTAPLDFAALGDGHGAVEVVTRRFAVAEGIGLEQARLTLAWQPGRIELRDLSGSAASGRWLGAVTLERAGSGLQASGVLRGNRLRLDNALSDDLGRPRVVGTADIMLTAAARGRSLRDLVSDLSGKGTLDLGETRVSALTPAALSGALAAALRPPADAIVANLRRQLQAAHAAPPGPLPLHAQSLPFAVSAGMLEVPLTIDTGDGRIHSTVRIDLNTLALAGDWRVERRSQAGETAPLPAVVVTFVGPLAALNRMPSQIDSEALEREIAVRKMERDVEELERLRQLDEARARAEAERRGLQDLPLGALAVGASWQHLPPSDPGPAAAPRPVPAQAPKPLIRPMTDEEMRKIFRDG